MTTVCPININVTEIIPKPAWEWKHYDYYLIFSTSQRGRLDLEWDLCISCTDNLTLHRLITPAMLNMNKMEITSVLMMYNVRLSDSQRTNLLSILKRIYYCSCNQLPSRSMDKWRFTTYVMLNCSAMFYSSQFSKYKAKVFIAESKFNLKLSTSMKLKVYTNHFIVVSIHEFHCITLHQNTNSDVMQLRTRIFSA